MVFIFIFIDGCWVLLVKEFRNLGLLFIIFYTVTIGKNYAFSLLCYTLSYVSNTSNEIIHKLYIISSQQKKSKIIIYLYKYQKYTYIITNKKIT
jgi:hypothetical protein